jgi:hypothetical protein
MDYRALARKKNMFVRSLLIFYWVGYELGEHAKSIRELAFLCHFTL